MSERLLSVGLDVGTTSTQLVVSRLQVENRASSFAVPELEISSREILYKSPVYFTPLRGEQLVDGQALRELVQQEYQRAGISREAVDTGAVIVTGETSRKENAAAVLEALSDCAGDFVVATAGPDLESVLAAKGAGAVEYSRETGKRVLHMDIGGGTSNLALIEDGRIIKTGCLNVGGRLLKLTETGEIIYVSPVLRQICSLTAGDKLQKPQAEELAERLVQALEMAAGLRPAGQLLRRLSTEEAGEPFCLPSMGRDELVISFSGGVADCIAQEIPWLQYGDLGPVLGQAIRKSRLCQGPYRLGAETIRATVIGAGCHSAQLSGSTVFYQNVTFPLKNLPVISVPQDGTMAQILREKLRQQDGLAMAALPGLYAPAYGELCSLAEELIQGFDGKPVLLCLEQDMAKALGQLLALKQGKGAAILCLDRVKAGDGSYLDVGAPIGPALPVVVKTLVLEKGWHE